MSQQTLAMHTADLARQFGELLEQHRGIVFKVAATYCRHADERNDLAQEIAAQLWRAFPKYDGQRPFSTWMYRIALNVAISFARGCSQRERHAVALDEDLHDMPADSGIDHESGQRVQILYRCIERFDPLNRALLMLYLDERSQRDIADILGISESNVATKIGRLKQRLRDEMAGA
jgi:RNA polymerase sigma-70 factor (ECF subfamily)